MSSPHAISALPEDALAEMREPLSPTGILIAAWGVFGVVGLLSQAAARLTPYAIEAIHVGMNAWQWLLLVIWTAMNAYGEGYRAFQLRFAPRVVVRSIYLARHPRWHHVMLAPAFCMSLFHATRRGKLVAYGTIAMVLCFIMLLRITPQPWRGIVDAGVVLPLVWGAVALIVLFFRAVRGSVPKAPYSLPPPSP